VPGATVEPQVNPNAVPNATALSFDIYTVTKPEQLWNALAPILVTEFPIVTVVNPELVNALAPILVTELGIIIDVKLEEFSNEFVPIVLTETGSVIDIKAGQVWKA
jgi:hypothetical protein